MTRVQVAQLVGLGPKQFDDAVRPRLEADAKTGVGAKLRYDAKAVVAAFVTYRMEQQAKPTGTGEDDELLNPDVQSDMLERLRRFKGDLAERDVKERDKHLVRRSVIMNALGPAVGGMRATGDRLTQKYGNDAGEIYNAAVENFQRAVEQAIGAGDVDEESADQ